MKERLALVAIWFLCLLTAVVGLLWLAIAILPGSQRAWAIAKGFDRLAAAFSRGDDGEYISSTCWRYRDEQPYRTLRRVVDAAFGRGHCRRSFEAEFWK